MVQPNIAAIGFCDWMLNISNQKLSGPQRLIVQKVYDAAVNVYPIEDQVWYNFNLFSAWRNKYYMVYRDYIISIPNPATLYYQQFVVPPTAAFQSAVNDFVQGCINDANWQLHDRLYLRATAEEQQATISMINPGSTPCTFNGGYSFNAGISINGDAATAYINTFFKPSSDGFNYSLNNACFWFYGRGVITGNAIAMGVQTYLAGSYIFPNFGGGSYSQINFAQMEPGPPVSSQGLTAIVLKSSATSEIWYNGIRIYSRSNTPNSITDIPFYELGMNNNGLLTTASDLEISMSGYGSGDIDQLKLYEKVQALATTLGFQV